jgi:hypothetical protein
MDSLDAQCLMLALVEPEMPPPDLWHHSRSGELSCAYSEGEQTFTWGPDAVADMARRWRESDAHEVPEAARPFVEAHERFEEIATKAGLGPPDAVVHDFGRNELRATWEDQKVVVVIDEIPHRAASGDAAVSGAPGLGASRTSQPPARR